MVSMVVKVLLATAISVVAGSQAANGGSERDPVDVGDDMDVAPVPARG